MGHTWAEMDPAAAAEQDRVINLEKRLTLAIRRLPLVLMSVGDLLDIMNVHRPKSEYHRFSDDDAITLKRILKKYKP